MAKAESRPLYANNWGDLVPLRKLKGTRPQSSTFYRKPRPAYKERVPSKPHPCEAEEHVEGCNGVGNTKDHFTPKSFLKFRRQVDPEGEYYTSIQRLSRACHDAKV